VDEVLICCSTPRESEGLPSNIAGRTVRILETGVGPVNAAFALTRALTATPTSIVIICGVGGAYPGSGLDIGDAVCASTERFGDLGAESAEGFLELPALGFPIVHGRPADSAVLTLDLFPLERRVPFVTCATCSGTDARAAELAQRTGGAVESMEGAALVQVAQLMGARVAEVRGISNHAGRRDRSAWRIDEAAAAARAAVVAWIEGGAC